MRPSSSWRKRLWHLILPGLALMGAVNTGAETRIPPSFLRLDTCPDDPGCQAMVLLDTTFLDYERKRPLYTRHQIIKIFTQEGVQEYSDVTITEMARGWKVERLIGRTILPDGRELPLKGKNITSKTMRVGKLKFRVKQASLPGVVPGAIVDWSYDLEMEFLNVKTIDFWILQREIPVLKTTYSIRGWPGGEYDLIQTGLAGIDIELRWSNPITQVYSATHIPPVPEEPFGPQAGAIQGRVLMSPFGIPDDWIADIAANWSRETGDFIGADEAIKTLVAERVSLEDPPRIRAQTLYRFIQAEIDTEKDDQPESQEIDWEPAENAAEVLRRGYGDEMERTLLFLSLAREAGLETGLLLISSRLNGPLDLKIPDPDIFDSFAASVRLERGWTTVDPATRFCPFGMIGPEKESDARNGIMILPDSEAGYQVVEGKDTLSLERRAPYSIVSIPFSPSNRSLLTREATVRLAGDGSAEVQITERGTGHADLSLRNKYFQLAEDKRREELQLQMEMTVPGAELQMAAFDRLESLDSSAVIRGSWNIPEIAIPVGDRLILTPSIFHARSPNPFTAEHRETPVYFPYAGGIIEKILIELPDGYVLDEIPEPILFEEPPFTFALSFFETDEGLRLFRRFQVDTAHWPATKYGQLKAFFERIHTADRTGIVIPRQAED